MFDAIQVKIVTNQIKGVCNRIDMILSDLDTLSDLAKSKGRDTDPQFLNALEDQALGQVADLQQLVLGMTMVLNDNGPEDTESEKFEVNTEKPKDQPEENTEPKVRPEEEDEGDGSAFQERELAARLAKKKEDEDHARRIEQRM